MVSTHGIQAVTFVEPMEKADECGRSWDKQTIHYILENQSSVMSMIRRIMLRKTRYMFGVSADDIYNQLSIYLSEHDDYDPEQAVTKCKTGGMVSMEGYVCASIKFCMLRMMEPYEAVKGRVGNVKILANGDEISVMDNVADSKASEGFNELEINLDDSLEYFENRRSVNDIDIYALFYVNLLMQKAGKHLNEQKMIDVQEVIGITKKDKKSLYGNPCNVEMYETIAQAMQKAGLQKSIEALEKHIYGAKTIKDMVERI